MSMKDSNDTIGNRTLDLPVCSAVPQPTAPPRAPLPFTYSVGINARVQLYICNPYMPSWRGQGHLYPLFYLYLKSRAIYH